MGHLSSPKNKAISLSLNQKLGPGAFSSIRPNTHQADFAPLRFNLSGLSSSIKILRLPVWLWYFDSSFHRNWWCFGLALHDSSSQIKQGYNLSCQCTDLHRFSMCDLPYNVACRQPSCYDDVRHDVLTTQTQWQAGGKQTKDKTYPHSVCHQPRQAYLFNVLPSFFLLIGKEGSVSI